MKKLILKQIKYRKKMSERNRLTRKYAPHNNEFTNYGVLIKWSELRYSINKYGWNIPLVEVICKCGNSKYYRATILDRSKYRGLCNSCVQKFVDKSRNNNGMWHGGQTMKLNRLGGKLYRHIRFSILSPEEQIKFSSMKKRNGYIAEHRFIVAKHLNRPLNVDEHIHHINSDILDNRIENLVLLTPSQHTTLHHKQGDIKSVNRRRDNRGKYI